MFTDEHRHLLTIREHKPCRRAVFAKSIVRQCFFANTAREHGYNVYRASDGRDVIILGL